MVILLSLNSLCEQPEVHLDASAAPGRILGFPTCEHSGCWSRAGDCGLGSLGRAHLLDGQVRASHTITDGLGTGRISDFLFDSD